MVRGSAAGTDPTAGGTATLSTSVLSTTVALRPYSVTELPGYSHPLRRVGLLLPLSLATATSARAQLFVERCPGGRGGAVSAAGAARAGRASALRGGVGMVTSSISSISTTGQARASTDGMPVAVDGLASGTPELTPRGGPKPEDSEDARAAEGSDGVPGLGSARERVRRSAAGLSASSGPLSRSAKLTSLAPFGSCRDRTSTTLPLMRRFGRVFVDSSPPRPIFYCVGVGDLSERLSPRCARSCPAAHFAPFFVPPSGNSASAVDQ